VWSGAQRGNPNISAPRTSGKTERFVVGNKVQGGEDKSPTQIEDATSKDRIGGPQPRNKTASRSTDERGKKSEGSLVNCVRSYFLVDIQSVERGGKEGGGRALV